MFTSQPQMSMAMFLSFLRRTTAFTLLLQPSLGAACIRSCIQHRSDVELDWPSQDAVLKADFGLLLTATPDMRMSARSCAACSMSIHAASQNICLHWLHPGETPSQTERASLFCRNRASDNSWFLVKGRSNALEVALQKGPVNYG